MSKRMLLLAGTAEAGELADRFWKNRTLEIFASFAGVTSNPRQLNFKTRFGGFGGVQGLTEFITTNQIDLILDGTHPFAVQIKKNASEAANQTNTPIAHMIRSPWPSKPGDNWQLVSSSHEAASVLLADSRPFLAIGKKELHVFKQRQDLTPVARMIEKPPACDSFSNFKFVLSYPLMNWQDEARLFEEYGITHLIARNSGGKIGYSKIHAARSLSLPVVMIDRPEPPPGKIVRNVDLAEQWIKKSI